MSRFAVPADAGERHAARDASPWPVQICTLQAMPLRLLLFASVRSWPAKCGKESNDKLAATRPEKKMKRDEIERLRDTVGCQAVLEKAGFALDGKESTKRAMKYRRGSEIIIVTHAGRGWFDPLSDAKGDIFGLVTTLEGCNFPEGCMRVAELSGLRPSDLVWNKDTVETISLVSTAEDWARRRSPSAGSASWRYLRWQRSLPAFVIRAAINRNLLREGPYGSIWAAHTDHHGKVSGWEGRGPDWRGFAKGGAKILFRLGADHATRLCVTEAAIDAMSLAAIEGMRDGTLYLSTGGGWAPATAAALRRLGQRPDIQLVAATDGNSQGDVFADRLRILAEDLGCSWLRLRPHADDWNEVLKQMEKEKTQRRVEKGGVPPARPPHQGRLRPAAPALDPADGQAGVPEGVKED